MRKSKVVGLVTLVGSVLAIAALYACSSDSPDGGGATNDGGAGNTETGSGNDTSTGTDGAQRPDVADSSVADAFDAADGFDGFDGNTRKPIPCTQVQLDANDFTNMATVTITFPGEGMATQQYTPSCMKVSKDTVVTFTGGFGSHPLEPSGGDLPTAIPSKASGTTVDVTMDALGDYGFRCNFHPGQMFGAIQVVP